MISWIRKRCLERKHLWDLSITPKRFWCDYAQHRFTQCCKSAHLSQVAEVITTDAPQGNFGPSVPGRFWRSLLKPDLTASDRSYYQSIRLKVFTFWTYLTWCSNTCSYIAVRFSPWQCQFEISAHQYEAFQNRACWPCILVCQSGYFERNLPCTTGLCHAQVSLHVWMMRRT